MFDDEYYMLMALEEAKKAIKEDEVPIGAVLVDADGRIIAKAYNTSEHGLHAMAHAETVVMSMGAISLEQKRLWDCTLFVTLEPCTMCAAAISFARIKNLYFGAYDEKGGAIVNGVKFYEQKTCHHKPNVVGGILENECSQILKDFFKNKRNKN